MLSRLPERPCGLTDKDLRPVTVGHPYLNVT